MVVVVHQTVGGDRSTRNTDLTAGSFIINYLGIVEWIDHVDKDSVITLQDLSALAKIYQRDYRREDTTNACKLICWREQIFPPHHQDYTHIKNKIATYKNIGAGI